MKNNAMTYPFLLLLTALAVCLTPTLSRAQVTNVIINEVHYDPYVKTELVEFIELYNAGTTQVDLAGCYFSDGISYTFPGSTYLDTNEYLIVGQNLAHISNEFGIAAYGPFEPDKLSNDGEQIELRNSAGDRMDRVTYQLGFPWPTIGEAPDSSMQLLNPGLDNDLGGSWRSGTPSPGAVNSVLAATNSIPPHIRQVDHSPNEPLSGQVVAITAKVTDPDGISSVTLHYQLVDPGSYISDEDAAYDTDWTDLAMNDSGTGGDEEAGDATFSVNMPAVFQTHRRLVRYRITVEDSLANTVRVPYADDPQPNFAYFVYDGVPSWSGAIDPGSGDTQLNEVVTYGTNVMRSLPAYHLISKKDDVEDCTWKDKYGGSTYKWTGTLVYDGEVYDHIHYRARGGVWRYAMGKNMWKFDFTRGHYLQGRDDYGKKFDTKWDKLNFSACIQQGNYQHRGEQGMFEAIGFKFFNFVGVPGPQTQYVQFRIIDEADESGATQYIGDFWGLYLVIEQMDGRFLDEHDLPDGNLYKMEGGSGTLNNQGLTAVTDKSDLNAFINGYKTSPATDWWRKNLTLDSYYGYRTIVEGIHHYDIAGGKNYFYYLNPEATINQLGTNYLWSVLPWDLDLTWANNMYGNGNEPFKSYGCLDQAELDIEYRNSIREIRDLLYNTNAAYRLIDEYAAFIDDPGGGPAMVDADRAMWDYNPVMTNTSYINTSKAGHGRFYQKAPSKDFPGMLQIMKDYIVDRSDNKLDPIAVDAAIPDTPTVSATTNAFPVNYLVFVTTSFDDPQGSGTFGAMKWHVGEITDTNSPSYDPTKRQKYEIDTVWESAEFTTFTNSISIPVDAVKIGHTYRVRVRMKDDTERWSHWSAPIEFTVEEPESSYALTHYLCVSEVMYDPPGGSDLEFIELLNVSDLFTLDLEAVKFTDGVGFTFQEGASLAPGSHLLVVGATSSNNFSQFRSDYGLTNTIPIYGPYSGDLGNGGEELTLKTGSGGQTISTFEYNDSRAWPSAADGAGHSLIPLVQVPTNQAARALDYGGNWRSSAYMKGSPGKADPDPPESIVINEVAAHTDTGQPAPNDSDDWIELYNPLPVAVDIGGWWLSDADGDLFKYQVPGGTVLASGAFMKFSENLHFHTNRLDGSGFGLDKGGERVYLTQMPGSPSNRVVDVVRFKGQENGVTLGRYPNGHSNWYALVPTPAAANAAPGSHVVISEIMYHPAPTVANPENNTNDEYVKIFNPLSVSTPLWTTAGVWRIDGGIGYSFPSNTTLAAEAEVMIVSFNPVTNTVARDELLAHYDLNIGDVTLLGPYSGQLDNQTDRVALEKPLEPDLPSTDIPWVIVDEVIYYESDPWPSLSDGGGPPLYRWDFDWAGNDPASWSTDPPAADTFEITSLSISGGTPFVTWHGFTNGEWYVERSTNLSDGFSRIATTTVSTVYHDTGLPSSATESYYRIGVSVAGVPVYTRNAAGYFQISLPSNGYSLVSVPFQKFPLHRGVVTSNNTLTITDDDASWTAGEFAQGAAGQEPTGTNSFYVEIRDRWSAFEGKMFPITTNSDTQLQIGGGATAGLTGDALAGASYAIVPEQRVRDIFGEPDSPLLVRGSGVGSADNILFWSGTSWQRIYNKDSGNPVFLQDHWLLGNTVVDDKAIGRDASFFLFRQATSNTVLHLTGELPAYNQWIDLDPGYNLVGGCWIEPVSIGDTSLQGTLKGGANSAAADAILEWGGSSWLGAVYYKSSGNPPFLVGHWVRGTTTMDSSFEFMPAKGYFIKNSSSNVWHKARSWDD
jgi:hypothetical protein